MKKILPLLLVAALAVGCKPKPAKMAAALPTSPPIFQVIPAGADPNIFKIPGAVGNRLQNSGGAQGWVMAPGGVWIADPPSSDGGSSGGGIAADGGVIAPLAGAGTVVNPLTITAVLPPCRIVAQTNLTLSGTQTIDGAAVIAGDCVLAEAQSTAANIGPYIVASGAWTRASWFSTATQMLPGATVSIFDGTLGKGTAWQFQTQGAITVGSTALAFAQVSPPSFGSDTSVPMPDSASSNVTATEWVSSLPVNTHGSVSSQFVLKLLSGGAQVTGYQIAANQFLIGGSNTAGAPNYSFVGDTTTGVYLTSAGNLGFAAGGTSSANLTANGLLVLASSSARLKLSSNGAGLKQGGPSPSGGGLILWGNDTGTPTIAATHRFEETQGASVASAQPLVLGYDGNFFSITGTTGIQGIVTTGWQVGARIVLRLASGITITNNSGAPGASASAILLRSGSNLTTSGVYYLELWLSSGDGWVQPS